MVRDHAGAMTRSSRPRIEERSTSGRASTGHGSSRGDAACARSLDAAQAASVAVQSW